MGLQRLGKFFASLLRGAPLSAQQVAFVEAAMIARKGTWQVLETCHLADGGIEFHIRAKSSGLEKLLLIRQSHPQLPEYRRVFNSCEIIFLPPVQSHPADEKAEEPYPAMFLTAAIGAAEEIFGRLVEA